MDPLEFYGYLSPKLDKLNMDPSFMTRNVNEGFSGGEKKRNEILQLAVLESEMGLCWTRSIRVWAWTAPRRERSSEWVKVG